MVWIDKSPQILIPIKLTENETILSIVQVPHTPLIIVLTKTSILLYDKFTLLPLSNHKRSSNSIASHGSNVSLKVKQLSVNTSQLTKLPTINLFIQTDLDYLIIYQVFINYNKSIYELTNGKTDETLQNSLPLSDTSSKFSISNLLKSATRTLLSGGGGGGTDGATINLENIENFNNNLIDDQFTNEPIELVKLSIYKVIKISIGIKDFWLKSNSHNLIIYNDHNDKEEYINEIQIINIGSFKNELIDLKNHGLEFKIKYMNYNPLDNYILLINEINEIWFISINNNYNKHENDNETEKNKEDDEINQNNEDNLSQSARNDNNTSSFIVTSQKLYDLTTSSSNPTFRISFNPQLPIILAQIDNTIKIFKIDFTKLELSIITKLNVSSALKTITWSPCGTFFITITEDGSWNIYSKFGHEHFNSKSIINELILDNDKQNAIVDFLKISKISIGLNSLQLYLINKTESRLYIMNTLKCNDYASSNSVFYNNEYLSILPSSFNNKQNLKFPILPIFKKIFKKYEFINGAQLNKSIKCLNGSITTSMNKFGQISMSFANNISVSTPITDGYNANNILWFNFDNYFVESFNIINHFWYDDYLIVINRFIKDDEVIIDELIVLDTTASKYGQGGSNNFKFDSDLIIWRHNFNHEILKFELVDTNDENIKNLVLVTNNFRLITIELSNKDQKSSKFVKQHKIFIGINQTIHLSSIKHKISLNLVQKISMIDGKHFLFLLTTGELFLLKNQTVVIEQPTTNKNSKIGGNTNIYELVKIRESIEYFKVETLSIKKPNASRIISLFDGKSIFMYDLSELINNASDNSNNGNDMIEPIEVQIANYYPLSTVSNYKGINLTGFEILSTFKNHLIYFKQLKNNQLILNKFIEYDLFMTKSTNEEIISKYEVFNTFNYCLELILYEALTSDHEEQESRLIKITSLIKNIKDAESIFINCLRKIEVRYWHKFFPCLGVTPIIFMNNLIDSGDVELCYNFLIVYLNFKREGNEKEPENEIVKGSEIEKGDENFDGLDKSDNEVILKIIKMLGESGKWDLCFQLCRFIKLLQPSNNLLSLIKNSLTV